MNKFVLAAALTFAASTAFAGGLEQPVLEPEVVIEEVEQNASTSGGLIIPLILLALIAVAAG